MKKAQVSTLATLIIVLTSALVIGTVVYKFSTEGKSKTDIEACRFSILSAAKSKSIPKPAVGGPLTTIKCPRGKLGDVLLEKKDIVDDNKINQDRAHRIIADAMAECWWMVGEGKLDPFSNWEGSGESYCLSCKTIYFDEDLLEFVNNDKIPMQDRVIGPLGEYLATTNMPNREKTYWNYLYKEDLSSAYINEMIDKSKGTVIFPQSQIILNMYKKESRSAFWHYTGVVVGGVLSTAAVVGGVLLAIPSGGISLSLTALGITGLAGIAGGMTLYYTAESSFSECPGCNAIGGISLIQPGTDLTIKNKIQLEEGEDPEEIPLCSVLVN